MGDFVREYLLDQYLDDYTKLGDGTLVGAIAYLNELAAKVPVERLPSVQFRFDDCGYGESSMYLKIWYDRPETAEELAEKQQMAVARADYLQAEELRMLAKLKEKYGE